MKLSPYSTITLTLREDGGTRVDLSFHTTVRARALIVKVDDRPFLSLESEEAQISVSTCGGGLVTDKDVAVAREIFNAAARYLADCERLNTSPLVVEAAS